MIGHLYRVVRSVLRERSKDKTRSPQWPEVRKIHLLTHYVCASCSGVKLLQVHHVKPYHLHPELELDPENLITLCMSSNECHEKIGHGGRWVAFNPQVIVHTVKLQRHLNDVRFRRAIEAAAKLCRLLADPLA